MRPREHVIVSAVFGAGVYGLTGSRAMAVCSFLAGVFVDVDHFIDYWREHPGSLSWRDFYDTCVQFRLKKAYLFLHSPEILAVAAVFAYLLRSRAVIGIALGLSQHFLFDLMFNGVRVKAFFLFYRLIKGAETEKVFTTYGKDHN
jgi:hypothetical protein